MKKERLILNKRFFLIKPFLYIVFLVSFASTAQNLVPNGSFEEIDSCYGDPSGLGFDVFEWTGCNGWSCPGYGSSDLWCENGVIGSYSPPALLLGYQYPKTGENLAGFYAFVSHTQDYREYIQVELSNSLEMNEYYKLSMYVNLSNESGNNSTSCLQAYFSDTPTQSSTYHPMTVSPQWKNNDQNMLTNSSDWTLIEGYVKANGGEKFITIGCFDDSTDIVVLDKDPNTAWSLYLYIDDVAFENTNVSSNFPNVFTPNEDGINDVFQPEIIGLPNYEIEIFNRWGSRIATLNQVNQTWDGGNLEDGVYFYLLTSSDSDITEQGFFHLIR